MGCDIHFFTEVRKSGVWMSADNWVTDEDGYTRAKEELYDGGNYDLFAILADVRNGRGFAGIKTGDGFNVIAKPRGLPHDVSPEVKAKSDDWGIDGHSHSFLTVAELKSFDWGQTTRHQGWVSLKEFEVFKETGKPNSWSGGVGGGSVMHVTNEQMTRLVDGSANVPDGAHVFTLVEWVETYAESAGDFLETTLPKMESLGNPEDVRAVFWFDN